MASFGFETLALVAVAGMVGPLLASFPRFSVPLVIGEVAAGLALGPSGLNIVDPNNATFSLLANIGFALVMFLVGSHVPIRDPTLRSAMPFALVRAVFVGVVAAALSIGVEAIFHTGHAMVYAVVMASSSAALALPIIQSLGLGGEPVLSVTAQIAIADTASIVVLPLVIDPTDAPRAALGGLAVAACAVALYFILRWFDRAGYRKRLHRYSEKTQFALELRGELIMLFGLAALAMYTRVSIMLAGFALGLVFSAIGEPRRVARQLFGISEGFFAPLFFVWLGASLRVRELGAHPQLILLGLALGLGALLAHCAGALLRQPLPLAVLSAAQLGVPVAAATLGTQQHLLAGGESAALMLGALVTIAATSVAGALARHRQPAAS
ncbi:MAG: cation:proton antiporter [Mycolicibacterium sp.]|nr:cation:proton antiporter [Mycolicibacterium sp.]